MQGSSCIENFTYENGNLVQEKDIFYNTSEVNEIIDMEYNADGSLFKSYFESDGTYIIYGYENKRMSMATYNFDGKLYLKDEYSYPFKIDKTWEYFYNIDDMNYCHMYEVGEDFGILKDSYYTGTPENLILSGYATVDSRDPAKENLKTKVSLYNADNLKLYEVIYKIEHLVMYGSEWRITGYQIYKADNAPINYQDIEGEWAQYLISDLDIKY